MKLMKNVINEKMIIYDFLIRVIALLMMIQ
jgi:hypothetical protein